MFGPAGYAQLDGMAIAHSYTTRVASLRDLIQLYDREVGMLEDEIHTQLRHHCGYHAIQAINGIGPTIAAVLWPRSATSIRFAPPRRYARGPVSPLATESPTSRPPAAR
jgi:hypothetical protein